SRPASARDILDSETSAECVRKAVGELPLKYREVLAMAYFGDHEYKEIAETLGITVTNVETRIYRAKKLLRELVREEMDG
ncbi:RNA polymerase sigma factor, partial [Candidatus Hydrogenedentota bacterium]